MKEKIKKFRATERGNAAFKLGLYFVFFIGVIIFLIAANGMSEPVDDEYSSLESMSADVRTYFDKQKLLLEGEYEFTYSISGQVEVNYTGKYDNGQVSGYKETDEDLIRYTIENGTAFINSLSKKEEYNDLYRGLNEEFFSFKNLFEKLNDAGPIISRDGDKKIYTYSDLDEYDYKIITDDYYIVEIDIVNENIEYIFEFSY